MSLLAIEILNKSRDFLLKAIDYNTQNEGVLGQVNFFQNNLDEYNEAIKELEQYEQKFKDKEFKYRTECQNVLSAGRLEADEQADRLAELEKVILDYYLDKGYQVGVGEWGFELEICSNYKSKWILILFWDREEGIRNECYKDMCSISTKDMFDKAIKHFSLNAEPLKEDVKLELDDTNQSAIYKIAGYESDGRE